MDRQIKVLFVFTANQYNVLNEMLWKLADCLERKHGFLVGKHRLDDYEKICGYEWDVVFCGQAIEFSKLQKVDGRVHMTWFVDHPRYLLPRILPYEQKENVWIGCVDRRHMAFLKKYYGIQNTFFAPHWLEGEKTSGRTECFLSGSEIRAFFSGFQCEMGRRRCVPLSRADGGTSDDCRRNNPASSGTYGNSSGRGDGGCADAVWRDGSARIVKGMS